MIPPYLHALFIKITRIFYGIGMTGIGIQHFIYSGFPPVIMPAWPHWMHNPVMAYIGGAAISTAGILIIAGKKTKEVALLLAVFLLLCFVFTQLPFMLFVQTDAVTHLGLWTQSLKELALAGGALVVAGSSGITTGKTFAGTTVIEKLIPFGKVFFSITLTAFGIDHFLYSTFVASLVPAWVPDHTFWTYATGAALIGSGVAIILKIKRRRIALLACIMLFLWFVTLHIPRAIADPYNNEGNETTSVFQALAFSGIALGIAVMPKKKKEIQVQPDQA